MNIFFLYSHFMPYNLSGIEALIKISNVRVHIVHYPSTKEFPYEFLSDQNITYYSIKDNSRIELIKLIEKLKPRFIFITGWGNKEYLAVAKYARSKAIPVITGCDTQWRGDLRQIIAMTFSGILIRKYFDYIMIPGFYQYEYARLLGFNRSRILHPVYTCNLELFNEIFVKYQVEKLCSYPKNILYVGRFEHVKGLNILIDAFLKIEEKNGWTLTIAGDGSLKDEIVKRIGGRSDIILKEYIHQEGMSDIIRNSGVFCLPSHYEPWGVVLHEFAAAGLILLASDICGSSSAFIKEEFNGFTFRSGNVLSLREKIIRIMEMSDEQKIIFSERSNKLAQVITPELYASNFIKFLS